MTIPLERTTAVLRTEKFLLSLCNPKETPRIPKSVRDHARSLLKHYPTRFDMQLTVEEGSSRFGNEENWNGTK